MQVSLKSTIGKNLGEQFREVGQDFKKSIEFIKTGKDVKDGLQKMITTLQGQVAFIRGSLKEIKAKIGYEPDSVESDSDGSYGNIVVKIRPEHRYEVDYSSDCYSKEEVQATPSFIKTEVKGDANKLKKLYNSFCYRIENIQERILRLEKMKDNLKDTQKFKLSSYELDEYGF
jgi:prophage DNA circulation protein